MKRHINFPSIEQFNQICKYIADKTSFVGIDDDGNVIRDYLAKKPKLTFKGTVKIHGTNAGVSYNAVDGIWYQSRNNIITPTQDNTGFAFFADCRKEAFTSMILQLAEENSIDLNEFTITIYGEWAGGSIQKGVGVCQLPKKFYIFGAKVSQVEKTEEFKNYWIDHTNLHNNQEDIYNVNQFTVWSVDIDFENPGYSQPTLSELTMAVEEQCPVAKHFGVEGVGEGIVWICNVFEEQIRFKVKGEKHSASKVKVLAPVNIEKLESIDAFVDYAVTPARFEQAIQTVFGINERVDIKKLGEVIKWMMTDIVKEETDSMKESGLDVRDISGKVAVKTKSMFSDLWNEQCSL